MKTVILDAGELEIRAAEHIAGFIRRKPDAVLALASGRTMEGVWRHLRRMCREGELSFSKVRILAVAELEVKRKELSCRHALEQGLIKNIDVPRENVFFPDKEAPEDYDRLIEELGGIDLAVLGLGINAHIGYNEPATFFDTGTRIQKITARTHRQLLKRGFGEDELPAYAVTMGIKTLVSAGEIILIAIGEEKQQAVFQTVYGKTITYIPASFLQIPLEVTGYFDTVAGSEL